MSSPLARRLLPALVFTVAYLGACNGDPEADLTPRSGTWMYTEDAVIDDTCPVDILPNSISTFVLDYDEGDDFQIELGAVDATCDIDGRAFDCAEYELSNEQFMDFDAFIRLAVHWSGELISSSVVEGNEVVSGTCVGEDCNLFEDLVPCSRDTTFTAEFIE